VDIKANAHNNAAAEAEADAAAADTRVAAVANAISAVSRILIDSRYCRIVDGYVWILLLQAKADILHANVRTRAEAEAAAAEEDMAAEAEANR
jgi:hypothetical protein